MRIGLIQYRPTPDRAANLVRIGAMIGQAAADGAGLVVLPELYAVPFVPTEHDAAWLGYAEPLDGPSNTLARERSESHGIAVVSSYVEASAIAGVLHNSVAVFDRGELRMRYRKSHIPLSHNFPEKLYFRPGDEPPGVFNLGALRIGVVICYERHFSELFRVAALAGAHLVAVPVAAANSSERIFHAELRGNAIGNQVYVAAVNRVGTEGRNGYYGMSVVFGPDGEEVASAGRDERVVVADVSVEAVEAARTDFPFYRDRRPDLYGPVAARQGAGATVRDGDSESRRAPRADRGDS